MSFPLLQVLAAVLREWRGDCHMTARPETVTARSPMFTPHGSTVESEPKLESPKSETPAAELFFDELYLDGDFEIRLSDLPPG
jgi:hypothetical protein